MKPGKLLRLAALAVSSALGACVSTPTPAPAPTPAAVPAPTPPPAPPPSVAQPVHDNWMDAPQTPGDWSLRVNQNETLALYGLPETEPVFYMRCERPSLRVTLALAGEEPDGDAVAVRVRTETRDRILTFGDAGSELPYLAATLPAQDPLLDAMAISKGRFAVETADYPTLYLPSWPEVTRVIEDCR